MLSALGGLVERWIYCCQPTGAHSLTPQLPQIQARILAKNALVLTNVTAE